jgi:GntR family transcriptional regulator
MAARTALPVHQQLSEMLIREIAAGRILDGEKLPPERDMAAQHGVAVGTLRKALGELTRQGLLERVQGSGNYVRAKADAAGIYAMFRLELVGGGGLPTAIVLDVQRIRKPADLPAFGTTGDAHRIRRLRSLGGRPAALEEIWLDAGYAAELYAADLSESLYLHYRKVLGFWIARAEDRIGVGTVPAWAPPGFGLAAGASCGFVERLGFAQDGASAEFSRTWFDHTVARYVSRLK